MAIRAPEIRLQHHERELLSLLARIVIDCGGYDSNIPSGRVPLSESEARKLLELLEQFVESKKFVEGAWFAEHMSDLARYENELREIYLSWRARHGRTRALASTHWRSFLRRTGIWNGPGDYLAATSDISTVAMSMAHFRKMESRLLQSSGLEPRVRSLILGVVDAHLGEIEKARQGKILLESGSIRSAPNALLPFISNNRAVGVSGDVPKDVVAAAMTVIADISVIFTTRDWSVAGMFSTWAAALATMTRK